MTTEYQQGKFNPINSSKYQGIYPIIYRSSWELKLMQYLDKSDACISWGSESCIVRYISPIDRISHRYFIDFTATFKDKNNQIQKFYIEIKPKCELSKPIKTPRMKETTFVNRYKTYLINDAKWKAASEFAKTKGARFIILTEDQLFR